MKIGVALSFCLCFLAGSLLRTSVDAFLKRETRSSQGCRSKRSGFVLHDFRLLIHGTKNAFTTVRPFDVLLYRLEEAVDGATLGLAALLDNDRLLPLCNRELGSADFFFNQLEEELSAEKLKAENRLVRIISADRKGTDCFVIGEYIDPNEVLIPLVKEEEKKKSKEERRVEATSINASREEGELSVAQLDAQIAGCLSTITRLVAEREELHKKEKKEKKEAVHSSDAPAAIGPYSQAIKAGGFLYVSGCIGLDPRMMRLKGEGIEEQTVQTMENLKTILNAGGCSLKDIVKITVLLKEMQSLPAVNKVYSAYLPSSEQGRGGGSDLGLASAPPARTCFAVLDLPANALVEIEAVAIIP